MLLWGHHGLQHGTTPCLVSARSQYRDSEVRHDLGRLQHEEISPWRIAESWKKVGTSKYKGMIALDDPMRAGPLSSEPLV